MDDTIAEYMIKHALSTSEMFERLLLSFDQIPYVYLKPQDNFDNAIKKPTRFYLFDAGIRDLQVQTADFSDNKLQIEVFHQIDTQKDENDQDGLDVRFRPLWEYKKILPFNCADDYYITLHESITHLTTTKARWSIVDPDIFAISSTRISPNNVYITPAHQSETNNLANNEEKEQNIPLPIELRVAIAMCKHLEEKNIRIQNTTNDELCDLLCTLFPAYKGENKKKTRTRIIRTIVSGLDRRGRPEKKVKNIK